MGHCSIRCIVPPVILDDIARRGSEKARGRALDTLALDASLRTARVHNAVRRTVAPATAELLARADAGKPHRTIFDAAHKTEVRHPKVVRAEGGRKSRDSAVNEAYDGLGDTYDFYWDIFRRDSIDDRGLALNAWVHYGSDYDNAFWDSHEMVFGDGDGQMFTGFTASLDVIGHELTHGVTEFEAGLQYLGQSGALNESISDVFGSLIQQYKLGQSAEKADWLIGNELVTKDFPGEALRSMKAPGTAWERDDQPSNIKDYVNTSADNGGVHTNSGIPNHAFYLVATELGGNAWEGAGRIWYEAVRDPRLQPTGDFRTFARLTVQAAQRLFGRDGEEVNAVRAGWKGVGIQTLGIEP